jgi:hypothetical protein
VGTTLKMLAGSSHPAARGAAALIEAGYDGSTPLEALTPGSVTRTLTETLACGTQVFLPPAPTANRPCRRDYPRGIRGRMTVRQRRWREKVRTMTSGSPIQAVSRARMLPGELTLGQIIKQAISYGASRTRTGDLLGAIAERCRLRRLNGMAKPPSALPGANLSPPFPSPTHH